MWPGLAGVPPLIIMAEALSVRFVSAATTMRVLGAPNEEDWGFRLTVSGRAVRIQKKESACSLVLHTVQASWV